MPLFRNFDWSQYLHGEILQNILRFVGRKISSAASDGIQKTVAEKLPIFLSWSDEDERMLAGITTGLDTPKK
jgi:hypothetical protein